MPDVTVSEAHSGSMQVTSHPIELGAEIADHLIKQPEEITIEGIWSNTPVSNPLKLITMDPDTAGQEFEKLLDLQDKGYLAYILTPLKEYANMALISWDVKRDETTGNAVFIMMKFKEVNTVELQEVDAPEPSKPRATPKKPTGRQSKGKSTRSVETKSLVLKFLQARFGAGS